jgi:hypothetical protein
VAQIGVLRTIEGGRLGFHCPGCNEMHQVRVVPDGGAPCWGFNGDYERPTFTPSVLVRSGHHLPEHPAGKPCWCTYNAAHPEQPPVFTCDVCHSFVTDGQIQFLGDCTHALAGQTVPLTPRPA